MHASADGRQDSSLLSASIVVSFLNLEISAGIVCGDEAGKESWVGVHRRRSVLQSVTGAAQRVCNWVG